MIGLEFLRHGNRFAARIRRRYFSAERISTAGNTSAFAGYYTGGFRTKKTFINDYLQMRPSEKGYLPTIGVDWIWP